MRQGRFVGRYATRKRRRRFAVHHFVKVTGPHLLNGIGESRLENSARDALKRHIHTHIDLAPRLLTAVVGHHFQQLGILRRPANGSFHPENFHVPRVFFTGCNAETFERPREHLAGLGIFHFAQQRTVVPCFARNHLTFTVGALLYDVAQNSTNVFWVPTGAERNVAGVHSKIAKHTIFAIDFNHAFPVDGLGDVHVAGMQKSGFDFDDLPELSRLDKLTDFLDGGIKRHLGAAANENVWMFCYAFADGVVGGLVDAEWFFAHEMLPSLDDGTVDFLMQRMRHGTVDGLDFGVRQQLFVIAGDFA